MVTIDVPTLRVGFWAVLGGVAAVVGGDGATRSLSRNLRIAVAVPVGLLGAGLVVAPVPFYLQPDIKMQRATERMSTGDFEEAIALARDAIRRRDEPDYRIRLIDTYGFAAREEGMDGRAFIEEATASAEFLETFPYALGHYAIGHALHQWAFFDGSVEEDALDHFQKALRLNPSDVTVRADDSRSIGREGALPAVSRSAHREAA